MPSSAETMHLVAMVTAPTSQYAENWRHPLSRTDWLSARFYTDLARTLERGCFDMMFMADALAVPEDAAGSYATTVRTGGKGTIYLDPVVVVSAAAAATTHLGLGATMSTTFLPPYSIARTMLSLDHLSGGRIAWNVVTSTTDAEARNMGWSAMPSKAERYDHADRVARTVLDLWQTWAPEALVLDTDNRVFADPRRIARSPSRLPAGPARRPADPRRHRRRSPAPRGRTRVVPRREGDPHLPCPAPAHRPRSVRSRRDRRRPRPVPPRRHRRRRIRRSAPAGLPRRGPHRA